MLTPDPYPPLPLRVGIQGGIGSFHHRAVSHYYNHAPYEIVPFDSFPEVFGAMDDGIIHVAAVALENSIAGFIHTNYKLLETSGLRISGELYLPVSHCLLIEAGSSIEEIREVHSHPMAILQCLDYLARLRQQGIRLVETVDTALSAKQVAENKSKHIAVIASMEAAILFGLRIFKKNIESSPNNFTRFVFLHKKPEAGEAPPTLPPGKVLKTSLTLRLNDLSNDLPVVLHTLANQQAQVKVLLQLTDEPGKHTRPFFLEFTSPSHDHALAAIHSIGQQGISLKTTGIYVSH